MSSVPLAETRDRLKHSACDPFENSVCSIASAMKSLMVAISFSELSE